MVRWTAMTAGVLCAVAAWAASSDAARASAQASVRARSPWGGGAYLGVELEEVGPDDVAKLRLQEERGALIKEVQPDTAASKAGFQAGDVILSYQGEKVQSAVQLARLVRETPPGRKVSLEVNRAGSTQRVTASLGEGRAGPLLLERTFNKILPPGERGFALEAPEPAEPPLLPENLGEMFEGAGGLREQMDRLRVELGGGGHRKLGIRYQELTGQLAGYFKVEKGLLVTDVEAGGPAGKAGIRAGDVILKINGKEIESSRELRDEVGRLEAGTEATVTLQRDGRPVDAKVMLGGRSAGEHASRPAV